MRAGGSSCDHDSEDEGIAADLSRHLSDHELVALLDAYAGTRLYFPKSMRPGHGIALAVGLDAATRLAKEYGGVSLRIPLAREIRARYHRSKGMSFPKIARRLGMTENGVKKLLKPR